MSIQSGKTRWSSMALIASIAATACTREDPGQLLVGGKTSTVPCPETTTSSSGNATTSSSSSVAGSSSGTMGTGGMGGMAGSSSSGSPVKTTLDYRVLDYAEALRTASFKLTGDAPTVDETEAVRAAPDDAARRKAYEAVIDKMMASPQFAGRMVEFWKNTFRMGGAASASLPSRDTAPTFAARTTVEGRPYTDLFTAATNTCPTFDAATGVFTDGTCPANGPVTAGLLTDRGLLAQYYSSFAFRRNRFIQEVFACRKQPSEYATMPVPKGAGTYSAPWEFESIAGAANGGRVDFLDTTSSICANCHATANHRSPLLAVFNEKGAYVAPTGTGQDTMFAVTIPVDGTPNAKLSDYLPAGQVTAWKLGQPAADLAVFGQAMANDAEVVACPVVRMWNFAMSKGDVVYDVATVPDSVIGPLVVEFKNNGLNLNKTIRAIFVHDDFVRF